MGNQGVIDSVSNRPYLLRIVVDLLLCAANKPCYHVQPIEPVPRDPKGPVSLTAQGSLVGFSLVVMYILSCVEASSSQSAGYPGEMVLVMSGE